MSLDVIFERNASVLRATLPIGAHWAEFGQTFGLQCYALNEFRNDYKLRTQVRLTAIGTRNAGMIAPSGRLIPPAVFPEDLQQDFRYSENLFARIDRCKLTVRLAFEKDIPWRATKINNYDGVFFDVESSTSIPSLWLSLNFQTVFHPPKGRPAPIEFEWGTPRVLSSGFETNRRKH
jgi:hypothetical protein